MRLPSTAILVGVLLTVSACGGAEGETVTKPEFENAGLTWPLTVDRGRIGCTNQEAWFETGGVRYGLNGVASKQRGYSDIARIWTEDTKQNNEFAALGAAPNPPIRVSIGDMISKALELCP